MAVDSGNLSDWTEATHDLREVPGTDYVCREVVARKQQEGLVARVTLYELAHQAHFRITLEVFHEGELQGERPVNYVLYAGFHYRGKDCVAEGARKACTLMNLADSLYFLNTPRSVR